MMRQRSHGPPRQRGTAVVEFAIAGAILFTVLFGVIEMGRALFVVNTLTEATRRAVRMAAVCPIGDPKPASAGVFEAGGGRSAVVPGLTTSNIVIEYLDANGAVLANPAGSYGSIRYVRARIAGFSLPLIVPLLMPVLSLDGFPATLPRESLGVPRSGSVQSC